MQNQILHIAQPKREPAQKKLESGANFTDVDIPGFSFIGFYFSF